MRTRTRATIAVAGAGLGGLTVALALLRRGWNVRVYEQAPALGEVGAGVSLSVGVGRALAALGVGDDVLAASLPTPSVAFAHYRTGQLLAGAFEPAAPAERGFETARHIHRADLHAILVEAVRVRDAAAVRTGKTLVDVEPSPEGVALRFGDGERVEADMLIAADGARSTVRRLLFDDAPPEFAGQVAFRCLVPREEAAPFMRQGAVVSVGPSRIFHRYALRRGTLVNVIGIARSARWQAEGWGVPASVQEFQDAYADFHPDVLGLIRTAPADTLIKWGLFVRPPLAAWSRGRVALLGDAAHPILPFLGLGAALAIEDAVVLARALDLSSDCERAFAAYQAARVERVERVRTQTIRQGEIIQAADPDREEVARSPSQDAGLFDYDPGAATIVV